MCMLSRIVCDRFEELSDKIKSWVIKTRIEQNVSQTGLAKRTEMSLGHMNRIEKGETSNLSLKTISKLADALGYDVEINFRKREDSPENYPPTIMMSLVLLGLIF